ncbi:MAG: GNAT family N-acetyltransferase [Clostridia bacterium]|nr:GNAT family N-acetyltransferase [Clostridia bacterium]
MTKREQCEKLYNDAFGQDIEFDKMLFDLFFDCVETLEIDGTVAAMYFKIPCVLNYNNQKTKAYYIYAVTTHSEYRHQGLMSKLFADTQKERDTLYFLKPSSQGVIAFYNQAGFKQIVGTRAPCDAVIEVSDNFKKLSLLCDKPLDTYPIMTRGIPNIEKLTFEYTLE